MRKLVLTAVAATALGLASAANATITVDDASMVYDGPSSNDGGHTTTIGYTEADLDTPTFVEWLTFTNTLDGLYSVSLSTSSAPVDFTSAVLSDGITNYALHLVATLGPNEFWGLDTTFIPAGQYTLAIYGNNSNTGSLGGSITITETAVPEPATWAMMLIGFGAIGWQLRRRRNPVLAQAV
jgi:hypothetical protein